MTLPRLDRYNRNFIINGGFPYWQRAISGSFVASTFASADRFFIGGIPDGVTSNYDIERVVDSPNTLTKHAAKITFTPSNAAGTAFLMQRIESVIARDMAGERVSFSIFVKNTNMQNCKMEMYTADVEDVFGVQTNFYSEIKVIDMSGGWVQVKFEDILIPSNASNGVQVRFDAYDSNNLAVPNDVYFSQIKINLGKEAQPYTHAGRDLVEELYLCQRYYEKSYQLDTPPSTLTFSGSRNFTGGHPRNSMMFTVRKRNIPVCTTYSMTSSTPGRVYINNVTTAVSLTDVMDTGFRFLGGGGSASGDSGYQWVANSEL